MGFFLCQILGCFKICGDAMHCVPTEIFPPTEIQHFKNPISSCGSFFATDARIIGASQDAGRYQIWVKTPSTQDMVPAGTKPILLRRSQPRSERQAPS
jgi:hypothetical protein